MTPPFEELPSPRDRRDPEIRAALDELVKDSSARVGFLVDSAGAARLAAGRSGATDPVAFPSLAAAHFNATRQLASLLGGTDFRSLAHQGDRTTVLLAEVGEEWILAVVFDEVRLYEEALRDTERAMTKLRKGLRPENESGAVEGPERVDSEWIRAAEGEIDRVFGEGGEPSCR